MEMPRAPLASGLPTIRSASAPWRPKTPPASPAPEYVERRVRRVLIGVGRAAAERDRRACLIVEDADFMIDALGPAGAKQLAAYLTAAPWVGFVLVARDLASLGLLAPVAAETVDLSTPADGPMCDALRWTFERGGAAVEDGAAEALLAEADHLPYAVKRLVDACWIACAADGRDGMPARLTRERVQATSARLARRLDPLHAARWLALTPVQRTTLLAVRRADGRGMTSAEVSRSTGLTLSTLQRAVQSLAEAEVLWRDPAPGAKRRARFVDPSFARWLPTVSG